ncbi:hypothetical protein [Prescottella equi]
MTTVEEAAPDVFRGSGTHENFVLLRDGDALTLIDEAIQVM